MAQGAAILSGMLRSFGLLLSAASLVACTSASHGDDTIAYDGTPGTVPAVFAQNVLRIMASVNGSPKRPVVVDTGAAITAFDSSAYADANFNSGNAGTVGLDGITFKNVPAVAVTICGPSCDANSVDGLFGANLLRQFVVSFDDQGGTFTLGAPTVPDWAQADGINVPFTLAGGGTGKIQGSDTTLTVPATRILVDVTIDGTARSMMVDTGASYILLRTSFFDSMVADGRGTLTVADQTVSGTTQGKVARSKTVNMGGASVEGAPVQTVDDDFVDGVQNEVGKTLDGLVGGSFLRDFFFTIDYPARQIVFHPYKLADAKMDEFHRVGALLQTNGSKYVVSHTLATTDAALHAPASFVGSTIVSIDKQTVDGLDPETVDRMLRGTVGDTRSIVFTAGGTQQTVSLRVDDVLPLK